MKNKQSPNEILRSLALERQSYKCYRCGIPNNSTAIRQGRSPYKVVDSHEKVFYQSIGIKSVKVKLRLTFLDLDKSNKSLDNVVCLCLPCRNSFVSMRSDSIRNSLLAASETSIVMDVFPAYLANNEVLEYLQSHFKNNYQIRLSSSELIKLCDFIVTEFLNSFQSSNQLNK